MRERRSVPSASDLAEAAKRAAEKAGKASGFNEEEAARRARERVEDEDFDEHGSWYDEFWKD